MCIKFILNINLFYKILSHESLASMKAKTT